MSKGLEALHRIANANNHFKYDTLELMDKDFQIVQQALQRLESIDNANPSEALKYLKDIGETCYVEAGNAEEDCILYAKDYIGFNTIKNYILKSQEQEKVLEIIKNKNVVVEWFTKKRESEKYFKLEIYNAFIPVERQLTEEEFNLLKRYCNEQDNKETIKYIL